MTTFLILLGLSLFILRSQLLRVAIREMGGEVKGEQLHASPALGAASGWASLTGALLLVVLSVAVHGYLSGFAFAVLGIIGGVALSSLVLPAIGSTFMLGHLGGNGDRSVAEFNRRYGAHIAFLVAAMAGLGWLLVMRML